jgi:hypothetical protein
VLHSKSRENLIDLIQHIFECYPEVADAMYQYANPASQDCNDAEAIEDALEIEKEQLSNIHSWSSYLQSVRTKHARFRALQDEMNKAGI